MDRGAWRATVHGTVESNMTQGLTHTHTHTHTQVKKHLLVRNSILEKKKFNSGENNVTE